MAWAPFEGFGEFDNALLVGNFGDGSVNAFDFDSGAFLGKVNDASGNPIIILGVWALQFGLGLPNASSKLKDYLLPGLDQGFSALLEDMESSVLLDETLVVCLGEMGRTPLFKNRGQQDGRDHWSYCFPSLLAGAGITGGMVYGRSDRDAAYPVDRPVTPADLAATIFEALGIDPHQPILDSQGRPHPIATQGRVLDDLRG